MKTHQRAGLQATGSPPASGAKLKGGADNCPPVPFRVHYADGEIRTMCAVDPEAARKAADRVGVSITKIKRDRSGEPR